MKMVIESSWWDNLRTTRIMKECVFVTIFSYNAAPIMVLDEREIQAYLGNFRLERIVDR